MPRTRDLVRSSDSLTSPGRVAQIQALAAKLAELSILNTAAVRARSLAIAGELVQLLSEEDRYQRSLLPAELDPHRTARQRLAEALRACREAGEQCELTRLHVVSERQHFISLRDVTDADVEIFYDYQRDPIAVRMAAFTAREKAAHLQHWTKIRADETTINRTILLGGQVAGSIGSWVQGDTRLIGYWIGREHWGQGVATTALRKFVDLLGERPLFAHVARHNLGSIRVLEKCGFASQSEQTGSDGVVELLMRLA